MPEMNEELRPKVMLVDDDEDVREILGETLRNNRFDVQICESGMEAVRTMTEDVQVVILDMMMPDMDGQATFLELQKKRPGIPVVFYSAFREMLDPKGLGEYKPLGFIEKGSPGSRQRLLELVKTAVTQ